jgi:hypothetical protein
MSTGRRWAKGCGCGCGLAAILASLLGVVGYYFISGIVREAKRADRIKERVREKQGRIADFQPDPDGVLRRERLEVFLHVRELMAPAREETQRALALLSSRTPEGEAEVPGLLGRLVAWGMGAMKVEAARGLVPQAIGFVSARGEALLEAGMGPGEYLYIYSLAYFSWLGKSPADGPSFPFVGDDEGGEGPRYEGKPDEFDVREGRREMVLTHLNEQLLPLLRRQLAALDEGGTVVESDAWRRQLAAEIAAMEKDRFRIPWRDGLPTRIETSLQPFRSRLEASYSPQCNPLEVLAGMNE